VYEEREGRSSELGGKGGVRSEVLLVRVVGVREVRVDGEVEVRASGRGELDSVAKGIEEGCSVYRQMSAERGVNAERHSGPGDRVAKTIVTVWTGRSEFATR
jgi:hypothetical protein